MSQSLQSLQNMLGLHRNYVDHSVIHLVLSNGLPIEHPSTEVQSVSNLHKIIRLTDISYSLIICSLPSDICCNYAFCCDDFHLGHVFRLTEGIISLDVRQF